MPKVRPKPAEKPSPARSTRPWWPDVAICLLILIATLAVYAPVRHFEFVNYDDPDYVTNNPHVTAGLTAASIPWAFTSFDAANWFPLTWLSHMADVQLFGMESGAHHLTNVLLHSIDALLLFFALKRLTRVRWPSAFVALIFALHPLHVESVAWIAERKDVLSAFFWFLALWCYARYAQKPSLARYLPVAAAFGLGLLAKPMIVTLPFVLLLLDLWPLRRPLAKSLLVEKLPLFAMAAAVSALTFVAQRASGAVAPLATTTLALRFENALVSYVVYIFDLFWPANLAVLYPLPRAIPFAEAAASALALAAISYVAVRQFRARPYLAVGWAWYLGTLVPVIGLVQVGSQSHADRYMYVPMVGLLIMLAWAAADLVAARPATRNAVLGAAAVAAAACLAVTLTQLPYWATTETLDLHTLSVTDDNFILRHNLADYYLQKNRPDEARQMESEALQISPQYLEARLDLGLAYSLLGRPAESEAEYRRALTQQLDSKQLAIAHSGLGAALASQHRTGEALPELQLAARLRPDSAEQHYNLATALAELGRHREAASEYREAIRLQPGDPEAHHRLAMSLANLGQWNDSAAEFEAVARMRPDDPLTQYNFALALARAGRLDDAIAHFSEALRLKPDFEVARRDLAAAQAQRATSSKR